MNNSAQAAKGPLERRGYTSEWLRVRILDHVLGGILWAPPPMIHVGMSLLRANPAGLISEPVGGGYARASVPNQPPFWPSAGLHCGSKINGERIQFPIPSCEWGLIRSIFLADDAQGRGGAVLATIDVTPRRIVAGPAPWIEPSGVCVTWM